jgi:hypothetical protein
MTIWRRRPVEEHSLDRYHRQPEKEAGTLSVRTLDGTVHHGIAQGDFVEKVTAQVAGRKLDGDVFA